MKWINFLQSFADFIKEHQVIAGDPQDELEKWILKSQGPEYYNIWKAQKNVNEAKWKYVQAFGVDHIQFSIEIRNALGDLNSAEYVWAGIMIEEVLSGHRQRREFGGTKADYQTWEQDLEAQAEAIILSILWKAMKYTAPLRSLICKLIAKVYPDPKANEPPVPKDFTERVKEKCRRAGVPFKDINIPPTKPLLD